MRGTLRPLPDGAWTSSGNFEFDFVPQGHEQYSYDRFPPVMCNGTTPCDFHGNTATPRALFDVWTGHVAPAAGFPLRPLWRLSKPSSSPTNTHASKYAYAVGHTWDANWVVDHFRSLGYDLDGLDGFVVSSSVGQPQGTVRLCRKQHSGAGDLNGDFVLFIEQNSPFVCQAPNDCSAPNGNCGINATYSDPVGVPALMGYVFPSYNASDDDSDSMPYNVEVAEGRNPQSKDNDVFTVSRPFAHQQVKDIIRRPAEDFEVIAIADQLDGAQATRSQVTENLLNSPDHFPIFAPVIRLYRAFLGRIPDYEGLEYWSRTLRGGTPLATISQSFATSEEFNNATGGLSNEGFVNYCYWSVLGRAPDPGGLAFWTGELNSGFRSRGQVMLEFSESQEFVALFQNNVRVSMLFQSLLRRAPLQAGYDYWLHRLNTGTFAAAIAEFIASPEYRLRFLPG